MEVSYQLSAFSYQQSETGTFTIVQAESRGLSTGMGDVANPSGSRVTIAFARFVACPPHLPKLQT